MLILLHADDNCTEPGCNGVFMMPMAAAADAPRECTVCGRQADTASEYLFFDAVLRHTLFGGVRLAYPQTVLRAWIT